MLFTSVNTELKSNWQPETLLLAKAASRLEASQGGLVEQARVEEDVQTEVCLLVALNFPVEFV